MKRCCTCHLWKKFEDFHLRAGSRDGRQARCRSCTRNWYEANKQEHKARTKLRSDGVRVTNRALMKDYLLKHPCVECGETDLRVLDFDHRPGENRRHRPTHGRRVFLEGDSSRNGEVRCPLRELPPHRHL